MNVPDYELYRLARTIDGTRADAMIVAVYRDPTRIWRTWARAVSVTTASPEEQPCTSGAVGTDVRCAAVCCTAAALGFGWVAIDDARGGTVDAEVVGIQHISSGRRVYEVRFDVAGRTCSAQVHSGSNPLPRDVHIGGISRLRYSASGPCTKVRETTSPGPGPLPIVIAVVAIGLWAGVWSGRLRSRSAAP
ncbi:hypothetical protein GCM10022255_116170 [Dactylosporangium darangshiense]|uniref:Uncharacterized protein n=1 Tax=Dactylosporangium darangshiense TaxID=579108 RepID=A0ABP8DWP8_9ACTN